MADDPAIAKLAANVKALDETLKAATRDANAARDSVKGLGEAADKAGDDFVDLKTTVSTALGNLASNAMQGAIDRTIEWVRDLDDAAARAERHQAVLSQLGGAYELVTQATNGAVSAEQAHHAQQVLAQGGLTLTGRELAAVTQRAREYARATGVETTQALEQLTDALRGGETEGLRRFGIALAAGTNKADAMAGALRQIERQAGTTRASMQTMAEASEDVSRAWGELNDGIAQTLAEEVGLRDFFVQLASWLRETRQSADSVQAVFHAVVGTMREVLGLRAQIDASQAQGQSRSGAFAGTYGQLLSAARAQGVDTRRFPMVGAVAQATPEEQQRLVTALTREINQRRAMPGAAGLFGGPVDLSTVRNLGEPGVGNPTDAAGIAQSIAGNVERRRQEEAAAAERQRREEEARRRAELARIRSATTTPTAAPNPDAALAYQFALAGQRAPTSEEWARIFVEQMHALAARDQAAQGGSVEDRFQGVQLQRQSREASLGMTAGVNAGGIEGARARAQVDRERITILREQREALQELVITAERHEEQARLMGSSTETINGLMRERIGIQTALAQTNRELAEAQRSMGDVFEGVGSKMIDVLSGTADAFGEAVTAALEGSKSFSQSVDEMLRATLRTLVKTAIVEGLRHVAQGAGKIAAYDYPGAALEFAAAGAWGVVGVAAGAGLSAMGPTRPPASAPAAPTGERRAASSDRAATTDRAAGAPLNLTLVVSGAAFTDAGVQAAAAGAVREAAANGYLTRQHLPGLFDG